MTKASHRTFFLDGPTGRLEALLWTPAKDCPTLAAVVCHPHPLYGGTMHNKVVFQVAKTLNRLGIPSLRFNFRGAGLSEGTHDDGRGEGNDTRAAIEFLVTEFPRRTLLLAGFSFGAAVGLRVGCADARVAELIGLGLPADRSDLGFLKECNKPKLFLQGAQDQFGSQENLQALVRDVPEPKQLVFVHDADHFFTGKLDQVDQALREWLLKRHPELEA